MIRIVTRPAALGVADYGVDLHLAPLMDALRAEAERYRRHDGRTIWILNSTEKGGGVAEMLPSQLRLLREMGIDARWAVLEPRESRFFGLTKRIHNALHGADPPRIDAQDRALYERISEEAAQALLPHVGPRDLLIVHDPQPLGVGSVLRRRLGCACIWRSHIGFDHETPSTQEAWSFLLPFVSAYDRAVFSVDSYVPGPLREVAAIIPPAIDPLSHKNRELSVHKLSGILISASLAPCGHPPLYGPFEHPARRLQESGGFSSATDAGDLGLLFRPVLTQISRWDRLKGFAPLLEAFVQLKRRGREAGSDPLSARRIALTRLVLAGPDPSSVADDPEAQAVLEELRERWLALDPQLREDVALLVLPMDSPKDNALMVNALQRCSTVVVQNSLREGFGLTATEAMYKAGFVLGTRAAGLRAQIDSGVHGLLVEDPEHPEEIADLLLHALSNPLMRNQLGRNARRRAGEQFLIPSQLRKWLRLIEDVLREVDAVGCRTGSASQGAG